MNKKKIAIIACILILIILALSFVLYVNAAVQNMQSYYELRGEFPKFATYAKIWFFVYLFFSLFDLLTIACCIYLFVYILKSGTNKCNEQIEKRARKEQFLQSKVKKLQQKIDKLNKSELD